MDDDLRASLRAAVRVWLMTARFMEAILDAEGLTQAEMLEALEVEQRECRRAMDTIGAELAQADEN